MGSVLEIVTPAGSRSLPISQLEVEAVDGRISVADLLGEDLPATATHATFESRGGDYRASIPLHVARRQGVVLLDGSGSPRLVVEEGDTLCWNVKDLARIRPTVGKEPDSVPSDPPH